MNEATKAYLAAMLDAEGSIGIASAPARTVNPEFSLTFIPRVLITNSHLGILRLVQSLTGFGSLYHARVNPTNPKWSPIHRWTAAANNARRLLVNILPYLVIKRRQAEIVIAFPKRSSRAKNQAAVYARQKSMFEECAALNLRGVKLTAVDSFPPDHPLLTPQRKS